MDRFEELEYGGFCECVGVCDCQEKPDKGEVRFRVVPDNDWNMNALKGDCFNVTANNDIDPELLKEEEVRFEMAVYNKGVWGILGEVFDGYRWECIDSVWGFVGDDWKYAGYDEQVKSACVDYSDVLLKGIEVGENWA